MEGLTREELKQIVAEAVIIALNRTRKKTSANNVEETLNFEEALEYLRSRNCVNSKSSLYKMDFRIIPYQIIARRRVYMLSDLKRYADRILGSKTA